MKRLMALALLACIESLFISAGAIADTILVPSQQATIQAGIDAASDGDTVLVACGTYSWESEGTGSTDGLIRLKSGIVLMSESGDADCVVIDAQSNGRAIFCEDLDASASIVGITITGGEATSGEDAENEGGAIRCAGGILNLTCCRIVGNRAVYGGGVFTSGGVVNLMHCVLAENSATHGGGLYSSGTLLLADDCAFRENTVSGGEYFSTGGGAYFYGAQAVLTYCSFTRNVGVRGGGIGANFGSVGVFMSSFAYNSGNTGGHCLILQSTADAQIWNCTLVNGDGANQNSPAIYWESAGDLEVVNSILWGDLAEQINSEPSQYVLVAGCDIQGGWEGGGNFSLYPEFCSNSHYLQSDSPCAPENNPSGLLIGAFPVACGVTAVRETSWSAVKALY